MNTKELIRGIDKRLLLAVSSVLIGIGGLFAGLYEAKANITVGIINETNVLDIYKPVEELSILFKGKDIQKEILNLKIVTLRIENDGGVDLLQGHYDQGNNWGIQVRNGEIIEARLIKTNSDYIENNLNLNLLELENKIEFNKIIFERDNYFSIEILILHDKANKPEIITFGKIAGIEHIEVKSMEESEDDSFIERTYAGNGWVQIVRLLSYTIAVISIAIVAILIAIGIDGYKDKRKRKVRKKIIESYLRELESRDKASSKIMDTLEDIYLLEGKESILAAQEIINKPSIYREDVEGRRRRKIALRKSSGGDTEHYIREFTMEDREEYLKSLVAGILIDNGILKVDKNRRVGIEKGFRKVLGELTENIGVAKTEH